MASSVTRASTKLILPTYFLHKDHYSLPAVRSTGQHPSSMLIVMSNSKTTHKNTEMQNMALNTMERTRVYIV